MYPGNSLVGFLAVLCPLSPCCTPVIMHRLGHLVAAAVATAVCEYWIFVLDGL